MTIYFIDNPKGGVGKSSISAMLTRALLDRGDPMVLEVETRGSSLRGLTGGRLEIDLFKLPNESKITREPGVLEDFYLSIAAKIGDGHSADRDVVVDFGAGTSQSFWDKASIKFWIRKIGLENIVVLVPTTAASDSLEPAAHVLHATKSIGISRRILVWNQKTSVDRMPGDLVSLGLDFDEHTVVDFEQTGLLQKAASAGIPIERIIACLDNDAELEARAIKMFPGERPMLAQMKAIEQFTRLKLWLEATLDQFGEIVNHHKTAV